MLDVREAFIRKNVKDLDFFQTVVKVDRFFRSELMCIPEPTFKCHMRISEPSVGGGNKKETEFLSFYWESFIIKFVQDFGPPKFRSGPGIHDPID